MKELEHLKRLITIKELYCQNLDVQIAQLKKRLKGPLSDYSRELLTNHLQGLDDEFYGYSIDRTPVDKLKAEIELLKAQAC